MQGIICPQKTNHFINSPNKNARNSKLVLSKISVVVLRYERRTSAVVLMDSRKSCEPLPVQGLTCRWAFKHVSGHYPHPPNIL